jgi:hypothetical protein
MPLCLYASMPLCLYAFFVKIGNKLIKTGYPILTAS